MLKRVVARCSAFGLTGEEAKFEVEFIEEFISPLFDEAAGGDDQDAVSIGSHNQFAQVKTRHDGFSSARIVRENKAQGLAGEHTFIDGCNLVG